MFQFIYMSSRGTRSRQVNRWNFIFIEGSTALHEVEAVGFNQSKIVSKSWKRFGFGSVPLEHHKTSGTRKQYEFQALSYVESSYILKQNGVEKKNDRKVKPQLILYLYPTHAYPKPSALAFHSIKIPVEGDFCLQGLIVSQSLCHNHCVTIIVSHHYLMFEKKQSY